MDQVVAVGVLDLGDRVPGQQIKPLLGRDLLGTAQGRHERESDDEEHRDERDVQQRVACELLEIHGSGRTRSLRRSGAEPRGNAKRCRQVIAGLLCHD